MKFLSNAKAGDFIGKVALLRLDFNTSDNWRMEASLPTIKLLSRKCKALVIISHKGRPKGFDEELSLRSMTAPLRKLLNQRVVFISHFRFKEISDLVRSSPKGTIFLLENLRFLEGEESNSDILAEHLASVGDIYVNDAFAVSHRANASVVAITKHLPSFAGLELEAEIDNLTQSMKNPRKPMVVILGGAKIEDKLRVYENLKSVASKFLIGGALTDKIIGNLNRPNIVLPVDFKRDNGEIRDIGPETARAYCAELKKAKSLIWNGPLGNIEDSRFRKGTTEVAKCLTDKLFSIVGGGETVMFLKKTKQDKRIHFISTGGGAMLDFLAGKELPGIKALNNI